MNGITDTIAEALTLCAAPPAAALATMQAFVDSAQVAIAQGRYEDAVFDFEDVARTAKNADFSGCLIVANYKGNLMSRGESAAFTAFDRFLLPSEHDWQKCYVPADLEIPIHETRPADSDPYPYPL